MKQFLILLLFALPFSAAAQCSMEEYQNLLKEAKAAQKKGQYDLALNKLFSAQECRPEKNDEVKKKILEVYYEVNNQKVLAEKNAEEARRQRDTATVEREKAEKRARENYASDLAYKSQTILRNGDRTTAFQLARFAFEYVDDDNPNVAEAVAEALYNYNENCDSIYCLPWAQNFLGHESGVNSITFSPDGKQIVTASDDSTAKIWDAITGKNILTLSGHDDGVREVTFSPDGKRIATASWDNTAKIWDALTGKSLFTLSEHNDYVRKVVFLPTGNESLPLYWMEPSKSGMPSQERISIRY